MARSRFVSRGWWKWQLRRVRAVPGICATALASRYRRYFPRKLSDAEQWDAWKADVETIQKHITEAFRHRRMFRDTTAILQQHPTLRTSPDAGYWYEWLRHLYAHYITMAVRRELDRGAAAPNLYRLLSEISKRPTVLSRARYLQHFEASPLTRDLGIQILDNQFTEIAGPGEFIDSAIVRRDLRQIEKRARLVVIYANKIVAHRTEEEVAVTMEHVNRSLEAIERLLQKYYAILTGNSLVGAEPSILVNWKRAFRLPWISPAE